MSRSAAVALLLAVVGPAAAQPPTPPPLPPQPLPVQPPVVGRVVPGGPAQIQEFAVPQGLIIGGGGPRGAGASAPKLVVARVNEGALVWSSTEVVPVQRQIDIPVNENGQTVTRKVMTTSMQPQTREQSIPLDGLKARDAAGKRIQPLALEIRLGKGAGVVLHTGPIADEIKAMFKADAVFVEVPGGGVGGFGQPQQLFLDAAGVQGGATFEFIAPAPGGAPQPAPRTLPAPTNPPAAPFRVRPTPAPVQPVDPPPAPRP